MSQPQDITKGILVDKKTTYIGFLVLAALGAVHIGNENSFGELLKIPSYYSDLLLALSCSIGLGFYIKKLNIWLNQKMDGVNELKKRVLFQSVFGIVAPSTVIGGIEILYLHILNIKIGESSILYLELPLILLLTLLINLTFLALDQVPSSFSPHPKAIKNGTRKKPAFKKHFIVQFGQKFINVPSGEVAYFKIENRLVFLVTANNKCYLYNSTFKKLLQDLPPDDYFQLNRQVIAKRESILESTHTATRRLQIQLQPSLEQEAFVSKIRAGQFMEWYQNG